jgi:membrane-associated phospholipid phosphatase
VLGFAAVTLFRSAAVGIVVKDPHGEILRSRLAISAALCLTLAVGDAVARSWRNGPHPREALQLLRARWTARRVALVASGLLAYHAIYFCYHNLKSWDVLNRPRDADLLRWDRWLFLGHSPAVVLHALLGQHLAAFVLVAVYESFSWLVSISFVAALVLQPRVRDGYVFIASAIWIWILGVASYYAIPSLGPFESAPQQFTGLPHTIVQDTQARYLAQRAHLLAHPHAHDAFAQVSAFASLHVGVTTVLLLMARHYRLPRLSQALTLYLALTLVATVYLGWHYVLDDLAGLLLGATAVTLGRWTVLGRSRA